MEKTTISISVKGQPVKVPAVIVQGQTIVITGKGLKVAMVHDEEWQDGEPIHRPAAIVEALKKHRPKADLFCFANAEPETEPRFQAHIEWDNVAVIRTSSYDAWWKGLSQDARRNVRLAEKRGISIRVAPFDDKFVAGIKGIYDETPIRQGRRFWHFGKPLDAVKRENSTYVERSEYIGAYLGDELIGFIKMVYIGKMARIMQILSMNSHFDKKPANAMIAKAVEVSAQKGMTYLAYCRYIYGTKKSSSITEFKRRNGFEELRFPRYYYPLTVKGRVALRLGLHLGIRNVLPEPVIETLLTVRAKFHDKFSAPEASKPTAKMPVSGKPQAASVD